MKQPFDYEPGSREAIAHGCTCPPQDGPGAVFAPDGTPGYECYKDCPMHGLEVLKRALAAGEAQLLDDAENDDEPTRH